MYDLRLVRLQLLEVVQGLPNSTLRVCNPDGWSILHVLEHLYLTEKAITKGIQYAMTTSRSDISHKAIERILDRNLKVKSPKFAEPQGLFTDLESAMTLLGASRNELETVVARIENADELHYHGFQHTYFGMLSIHQWLQVLPLHERRHIAQIEEMGVSNFGF